MKIIHFQLFYGLLFALIAISCGKETAVPEEPIVVPEPPIIELGRIRFMRDNEKIDYLGRIVNVADSTLLFATYGRVVAGFALTEKVIVSGIPNKLGKHRIRIPNLYNEWPSGGVYFSIYDELVGVIESTDNYPDDYVEILKIDEVTGAVQGKFQFHGKNFGNPLSQYQQPDSLYISEGVFHLKPQ
jgi:hypothetical protein